MSAKTKSRIKIALLIIGASVMVLLPLLLKGEPTPKPERNVGVAATVTPGPFTISDAEIAKISRENMVKTLKSILALYKDALGVIERQKGNLANATGETASALGMQNRSLANMTGLVEEVQRLKKHDEEMTDKVNKLSKALWWYRLRWWGAWVVFGLGLVACIVLAFLKFTGRLSLSAAKIAGKI